jgi:EAL domain-containing protein (putative c-di-GMP-specific phosphodiesterase class I)/GAF domain-containing protein
MHKFPVVDPAEQQRLAALRRMCILDTPPDPALDCIVEFAGKLLNAPIVLISLVDQSRQWFKARVGLDVAETPREQSFCALAIKEPGVMIVPDAMKDSRFSDNPLVLGPPYVRFYAGAPLKAPGGLKIGTLCVIDTVPRSAFTENEQSILCDMAEMVMIRLETLRSIGYVNPLTGLLNHNGFLETIEQLIASGSGPTAPALLAAIDVVSPIHYDEIVRAIGLRHGEQLLITARNRLQMHLPQGTTVYHIGAARFAAVFRDVLLPAPSETLAAVTRSFREPIDCGGVPVNTSPSIGFIPVRAGSDAAQLLRELITTLDDVREKGVEWAFYDPAIDIAQQRAFAVLTALHEALVADKQLSLCYQPRVDLGSCRLAGVEALLRWNHPALGAISPAEFIPLAEKTALIGAVTDWVITNVLKQIAEWRGLGHHVKVSVNVSAYDMEKGDFAEMLSARLALFAIDPESIELEFTENALVRNPARVHEQLSRLRTLGTEVAIDDFGTGYCNISYLKLIPASVVKIDQSFIRTLATDASNKAIVRSMIGMAHALGHAVVAEGIETGESYDLLREWGCDEGQGYHIARPMGPSALIEWIDKRP